MNIDIDDLIKHAKQVQEVFYYMTENIFNLDYNFRIMKRRKIPGKGSVTLGYIDFSKKIICLDILTLKKREPKKISSILSVLAHEIAHIQKPPFRQRYKGKYILRQHYPAFYQQVSRNIRLIKKDKFLQQFFS